MGKKAKEHRKKVAARNARIDQARKSFRKTFQAELMKEIEAEKARRMAEDPEFAAKVEAAELAKEEKERGIIIKHEEDAD